MKYYNYNKAIQYINERKESIDTASLGMHEDWAWTADTIFEDGKFTKELFIGDIISEESKYRKERANGLSLMDNEYDHIKIAGIAGSDWATPTLEVVYKDGTNEMVPCYITDTEELDPKEQQRIVAMNQAILLGPMSGPVQANITPLKQE